MHSLLTAVVLCIFAHAALAQCVDSLPTALDTRPGAEVVKKTKPAPMPTAGAVRPGGELIKTAAAGTHDAPPIAREVSARATADQEEPPRRGGPAMLLAALALMSGIALRRYGANK
ncbi:hypothetical protein [Caenimonas soli]|uniref:hypothetical protein n=1 Tax=Caenimonas soli TaxID=2735555 RepID=UPI0015543D68|nr:hypothetical protein [Caenimonas soli]NPC57280.1 hypothetical protein [Caenimonas soli]